MPIKLKKGQVIRDMVTVKLLDRFLEWSFQRQANKLYKRRKKMSIDKVTPQEWDRLGQMKRAKHDTVNRTGH